MSKRTAFAGFIALLLLAACSKQEPPAAASAGDPDEEEQTMAAPPAPEPAPPQDYSKTATGMMSLLSDKPECQRFHEELRTIAQTPLGSQPARDPAYVVAEAHAQGCSKKSEQQ
jgi:hypothetical protein